MATAATELEHAQVLWDFHYLDTPLQRADFVLALGSHDERVAEKAADLVLQGWAPTLVTSGGLGKVTAGHWTESEGERFAQIAQARGVESSKIIVEAVATNTGENITKTRELLDRLRIPVGRGILVTKPYMRRRAYATAAMQWPEVEWLVSSPAIGLIDYPTADVPLDRMINLMVGDLQRLDVYAEQGFQIPQQIPSHVRASYEFLKDAGYDRFVIKTT
ncbi:MAG: hypothetical protein QOC65_1484 [Sphingomonadales bacterium]|nr:hypothetical protein [Sphingomonadales bacterium]